MFELATLFSSKTRVKVLEALFYQSAPLPLRQIASLSDSPLFSVQRVLKQLVDEKLLIRKKRGRYTLFERNPHHEAHVFLAQLFDLEMKFRIASLSKEYGQKAEDVLDFSHSARDLFEKVRL